MAVERIPTNKIAVSQRILYVFEVDYPHLVCSKITVGTNDVFGVGEDSDQA
jgi:hypothetical protein